MLFPASENRDSNDDPQLHFISTGGEGYTGDAKPHFISRLGVVGDANTHFISRSGSAW